MSLLNPELFKETPEQTAYDLLKLEADSVSDTTRGHLKMIIEPIDTYVEKTDRVELGTLYRVYFVAPHLGNYRQKILTIAEMNPQGRFPVNIVCELYSPNPVEANSDNLIEKVREILANPNVSLVIRNLYNQSVRYTKDYPTVVTGVNL